MINDGFFFSSYQNEIVNMVRTHPQTNRILCQINSSQSLDEIISVLCRNLGLDPCEWSQYTGSLNPPAVNFAQPYNLSRLDARLNMFYARLGSIVVLSNRKIADDLRSFFNITGVIEISEFEALRRAAKTISEYQYSRLCAVIGEVGDEETVLLIKNGKIKSMTINSAPLCHVEQIFIVGRIADRFPPHLRSGFGECFADSVVVRTYYRRAQVTVIRTCSIDGEATSLLRWGELCSGRSFICFEQGFGTLRSTTNGLILAKQQAMEDRHAFVLRANALKNGQAGIEGEV